MLVQRLRPIQAGVCLVEHMRLSWGIKLTANYKWSVADSVGNSQFIVRAVMPLASRVITCSLRSLVRGFSYLYNIMQAL